MKTAKDLIIPFHLAEKEPILGDQFFYVPKDAEPNGKKFLFFEKDQPICIEFCSGNGQWIFERAKAHPHLNWLAVEKKFQRAKKIWKKGQKENLQNLVTICSDALIFTKNWAPNVQEVYINFPDPWPKRRHAKNRIISKEFIEALSQITSQRVTLTCATDHEEYQKQMQEEFETHLSWQLKLKTNNLKDYGSSFFQELWLEKGKTIYYLIFERQ